MLQPSTLKFLKSLKKNNNKPLFDENREKYESARANFQEFITGLLQNMAAFDPEMKDFEAKKCMFRINRDIRFSKNKTPYKINISAHFNKGGKKSVHAGYYFHLQPGGNSFIGGGLWMPEAAELKKLRQEIDYCFPEFKKIVHASAFQTQYGALERDEKQMLVNVPRGYEKENPAADLLKMKSFVATKNISDSDILRSDLNKEVTQAFKALMPLIKFINRAVE